MRGVAPPRNPDANKRAERCALPPGSLRAWVLKALRRRATPSHALKRRVSHASGGIQASAPCTLTRNLQIVRVG